MVRKQILRGRVNNDSLEKIDLRVGVKKKVPSRTNQKNPIGRAEKRTRAARISKKGMKTKKKSFIVTRGTGQPYGAAPRITESN